MKRFFLMTAIVAAISTTAFAQVSVGIQVGGNLAFTSLKYETGNGNETAKVNTDPKFGFVAGLVSEFQLGPVSLRPELNFIQKGYKSSSSYFGGFTTTDNKATLNYIELPLNVTFNVPSGGSHLFFGLGPVFSLGLSGKYKSTGTFGNASQENTTDVKFDGDENANDDYIHLKRFDFGADVIAGYKLDGGFTVALGYTFGISNILPKSSNNNSNDSYRNSGLALKVGYMFGGGSEKSSKSKTSTGTM
ncbi:MAG: porin family protein [Ferruginibacter sp.]